MSPQNDTPQHNDDPALILALDIWGDENMRGDALDAIEALKEAGFEITKTVESAGQPDRATLYGVTKGLPGIAAGYGLDGLDGQPRHSTPAELTAALDLIGRRTDIVAIQLPEPEPPRVPGEFPRWELAVGNLLLDQAFGEILVGGMTLSPRHAGELAAALLAANARTDAANAAAANEEEAPRKGWLVTDLAGNPDPRPWVISGFIPTDATEGDTVATERLSRNPETLERLQELQSQIDTAVEFDPEGEAK